MSRPEITIDWENVESLMVSGCSGIEIAGHIGVNKDTLYDRVAKEKCMSYSDYSAKLKAKGESILRDHQYKKALGLTDKGDNTLLIWLGKCRLKQRENDIQDISPHQEALAKDDVNFKLQAENALLKQQLADNAT